MKHEDITKGRRLKAPSLFSALILLMLLASCSVDGNDVSYPDQDLRMTFLHTTDTHSKTLPFTYVPTFTDQNLGIKLCDGVNLLGDCQLCLTYNESVESCQVCKTFNQYELEATENAPCEDCLEESFDAEDCRACLENVRGSKACADYTFGGAARAAYIINREREKAVRAAYVDTGDFFQGAPIFNLFRGEAEVRVLSAMMPDAVTLGNHEFDPGATRLAELMNKFRNFPLLNANYLWEDMDAPGSLEMARTVMPATIRYYNGIKVGYIGMGNVHSLTSLGTSGNSMRVRALDEVEVVESWVGMIRPLVDLVVLVSHLGVASDQQVASRVAGIDIIFGGHDHVVIMPPAEVINPEGKKTLVVHSGVNFKFVGKLDVVVRNGEVVAHEYTAIPIYGRTADVYDEFESYDGETNINGLRPDERLYEDELVANILYNYQYELQQAQDLSRIIGVAGDDLPRYGDGDSPLGNLVADAIRARRKVETDFSVTNSLGIRADIDRGEITLGKLYEVFPFENTVVVMQISGAEIKELFDYSASRSASYGCKTQIQVSGAKVEMDCSTRTVKYVEINGIVIVEDYTLMNPHVIFSMATNDYIANGGSGFDILERNTTKVDTMISLRDVVMEFVEENSPLEAVDDGRLKLIE